MYGDARSAYDSAARATASSRELEAAALYKAARLLEASVRDWTGPSARGRLHEALRHNQKLWTFFQTELSETDHPFPRDLRTNLLSLSLFVDRRTFEVMRSDDPAGVRALIDINRHIADGLSTPVPDTAVPRT
jgi:flagellar protein FlaF